MCLLSVSGGRNSYTVNFRAPLQLLFYCDKMPDKDNSRVTLDIVHPGGEGGSSVAAHIVPPAAGVTSAVLSMSPFRTPPTHTPAVTVPFTFRVGL